MKFVTKIIILATVLVIVALIYHYFFNTKSKRIGYDDLFEKVLTGRKDVREWSCTIPTVIGQSRLREAELLAERLPEGKILVAKEINKVWIGNDLFFIEEPSVYAREKAVRVNAALRTAYARALRTGDPFVFPGHVTDGEVRYMNQIQQEKYAEWKCGITEKLNKKLTENRGKLQASVRKKYLRDTGAYLKKHNLKREAVLPRAVQLLGMQTEPVDLEEIVEQLQEDRALKHAMKQVTEVIAEEAANEVPLPRNNAADWPDPLAYARAKSPPTARPAFDNTPRETVAERVNRIRKEDNRLNSTFSQSVHDATFSSEVNAAISEEGGSGKFVTRLSREFFNKYPKNALLHQELFKIDKDKDYLKAFARIVYDEANDDVRDNILEALNFEIGTIAGVCDEGRKNKTWALLTGIDKSGHGNPVPSRIEIIDSLLLDFGNITNKVGLTSEEMIVKVSDASAEYSTKYPALEKEITKKLEETKLVITDLYDDEVNLYGTMDGKQIGDHSKEEVVIGGNPWVVVQETVEVVPEVILEVVPEVLPEQPSENFSIDHLLTNPSPFITTPIDSSRVVPTTPGAVFDFSQPLIIEN